MHSEWQQLLQNAGAHFELDQLTDFGDLENEVRQAEDSGNIFSPLTDVGVLNVSGADAVQLLQGQLTADVSKIEDDVSRPGAWCTPKGRVIVFGHLYRQADAIRYVIPVAQVTSAVQRLGMYVFRADVKLVDLSDTLAVVGLAGDRLSAWAQQQLGIPFPAPNQVTHAGSISLIGLTSGAPRAMLIGPREDVAELWPALSSVATPVGTPTWRLGDIKAGQPWLPPSLSEQFLPQMLNLDRIDGVSFDKGCYVGQEIVARTQHLGRLKRRMFSGRVESQTPPVSGDPLYLTDPEQARGDHAAGTVVSAGRDASGHWRLLAVVNIADAGLGNLRLHHVFGPPVELDLRDGDGSQDSV